MPLSVVKRNRLYRLVEPGGKVATSDGGKAVDGGGHMTERKAEAQRRAIEANRRNRIGYTRSMTSTRG